MPEVTFKQEGRVVEVDEGTNLRQAAREAGVSVYPGPAKLLNCMGNGLCGTCLVYIEKGIEHCSPAGPLESANLTFHPITLLHSIGKEDQARLACQVTVHGDIVVDTDVSINLYGKEHSYAEKMRGEREVEFPENAPRGVREKKKREEEGESKDWFHKEREVREKSDSPGNNGDTETDE